MAVSVKKQANALLAGVSLAAAASYPWAQGSVLLDFVHHTALAATIGGLADWWGVTAIFEKPFNILRRVRICCADATRSCRRD